MLTYSINNIPLLLDADTTFKLSGINPACVMDGIPGDAGLGLDIPVNPNNRALLGNPERFEKYATTASRKFPGFEIRFSGVLLMAGTLVIKNATPENYSGWLQSEVGVMGEALQNKKMPDMNWPVNQGFDASGSYSDTTDDYCCPIIRNPGFFDGKGREEEGPVQYIDENGDTQTKNETRGVLVGKHWENFSWLVNNELVNTAAGCVISPCLYLRYVLRESLRMNGWYINRNDMLTVPHFTQLAIYNNLSIVEPVFTTEQQPVVNWDYENNQMKENQENIITEQEW
jgi:hypothetical protein